MSQRANNRKRLSKDFFSSAYILPALIIVPATASWVMPTQIQAVDFLTFVGWAAYNSVSVGGMWPKR